MKISRNCNSIKLQVNLHIKMFLAFSLLLVGWQACYAFPRDNYLPAPRLPLPRPLPLPLPRPLPLPLPLPRPYPLRSVQFPDDFSFGVSTSAYQVEGAWNKDDKGENIWDRFVHTHPDYANGTNGDVAANAYYKMKEDLDLLNLLNVGHYKMSISWSRLLPNGLPTYLNPLAVEHYRKQFKLLRANQIEPFVTLYHWDLPQALQDMGGFQNESIATWFADYARIAFNLFGDDVKYWSTFNEPYQICANGYGGSMLAPAINKSGVADYICGHNLLKAHAAAYHVYDNEFRTAQDGRISINLGVRWVEAATDSVEDTLAAETQRQFYIGWFAHPIYKGDYPKIMKDRVWERSILQGLSKSRLPKFSKAEIDSIKGTHDYFALNNYDMIVAEAQLSPLRPTLLRYDVGTILTPKEGNYTYGIRKSLGWIKNEYNNPSIFITEDGFGTKSASLEDPQRIAYMKKILANVYDAMTVDKVRVYGYTCKNFMDGYEWNEGYMTRKGLYAVDFKDPKRPRTPRSSALWYREVSTTGYTGGI